MDRRTVRKMSIHGRIARLKLWVYYRFLYDEIAEDLALHQLKRIVRTGRDNIDSELVPLSASEYLEAFKQKKKKTSD